MALRSLTKMYHFLRRTPHINGCSKAYGNSFIRDLSIGSGIRDDPLSDTPYSSNASSTHQTDKANAHDKDSFSPESQEVTNGKIPVQQPVYNEFLFGNNGPRNGPFPSRGVYKAIILGEVGTKPLQKIMRSGRSVTIFTVGTGGMRNNRKPFEGETPKEFSERSAIQWHRIAVYQEIAGGLAMRYLKQGSQVYLEGNLETRIYNDPNTGVLKRIREIAVRQNGRLLLMNQAPKDSPVYDSYSDDVRVEAIM